MADDDDHTFYAGPTGIDGVSTTQWAAIRDGALRVCAHDVGQPLEDMFGNDEREWFLEMPVDRIPALLAALIAERFGGGPGAISDFEAWCLEHGLALRKVVIP